jgi:uncharacterized protein (DUF486 family)
MTELIQSRWLPVLLLVGSNVFMTFAWYGHLRFQQQPPVAAHPGQLGGIALFESCLMVPANRWGHHRFSAIELKIIQEVITLAVFSGFVLACLNERVRWNHLAAFACILAAVAFTFLPGGVPEGRLTNPTGPNRGPNQHR